MVVFDLYGKKSKALKKNSSNIIQVETLLKPLLKLWKATKEELPVDERERDHAKYNDQTAR